MIDGSPGSHITKSATPFVIQILLILFVIGRLRTERRAIIGIPIVLFLLFLVMRRRTREYFEFR